MCGVARSQIFLYYFRFICLDVLSVELNNLEHSGDSLIAVLPICNT